MVLEPVQHTVSRSHYQLIGVRMRELNSLGIPMLSLKNLGMSL